MHRGQGLLLLAVGVLAGAVLAVAVMSTDALRTPLNARAERLLGPSKSGLPASIDVSGRSQGQRAAPASSPQPTPSAHPTPAPPPQPVTVVSPPIYAYPPDDGGSHRSPGGSGSGHSGSGGSSGT